MSDETYDEDGITGKKLLTSTVRLRMFGIPNIGMALAMAA
jgi:hypothetical protein